MSLGLILRGKSRHGLPASSNTSACSSGYFFLRFAEEFERRIKVQLEVTSQQRVLVLKERFDSTLSEICSGRARCIVESNEDLVAWVRKRVRRHPVDHVVHCKRTRIVRSAINHIVNKELETKLGLQKLPLNSVSVRGNQLEPVR